MPGRNLLDEIAQYGNFYLSDLHQLENQRQILPFVLQLEDAPYSLGEWNEAMSYILGAPLHCATVREAKEAFQNAVDSAEALK